MILYLFTLWMIFYYLPDEYSAFLSKNCLLIIQINLILVDYFGMMYNNAPKDINCKNTEETFCTVVEYWQNNTSNFIFIVLQTYLFQYNK